MRWFLVVAAAVLPLASSHGQEQEKSLVDRLLRPDMSLANTAYNKKFAPKSVSIESRGTVGTFYLRSKPSEPHFNDERSVSARQYRPQSFDPDAHAKSTMQVRKANTPDKVATTSVAEIHPAYDSAKTIASSSFAGERPFREQGKSQKSLDRQNPPLTIDQVRELLNRNK